MNAFSLQTSTGVDKFRRERTLGPQAQRLPVNNVEQASRQLVKAMEKDLPQMDESPADAAAGWGKVRLRAPGQDIFIAYDGDATNGSYTQQTVVHGRGLGYTHTEFTPDCIDSLQVGPAGARVLHIDRRAPQQSYAEVLGQPWNVFGTPPQAPEKPTAVAPEKMLQAESGLSYAVLREGSGPEAKPGQPVLVHYTGWLQDGTKFDSSLDRRQSFEFRLGAGGVIAGWEQGVSGMRVGEKRKLVVPPELGYGSRPMGIIPSGSTLEFEVELLATAEA